MRSCLILFVMRVIVLPTCGNELDQRDAAVHVAAMDLLLFRRLRCLADRGVGACRHPFLPGLRRSGVHGARCDDAAPP